MLSESERQTARRELLADFSAALLDQSLQADLVALANRTAAALVAPARGGAVETPNGITTHVIDRPVVVEGNTAAAVFADVRRRDKADFEPLVEAVAAQLAVALERQRLLLRERESAASLIEQNQRLKELDEMKTRFVSAASHELRTPLASIVGYVELLRDGEVGALNDEQQEFVNIISRNCDRLNSLVDDILFLGRADSDRLTLAPSDVDITSLVATELESLRAAAERRGVALVLEPGEDRPTLTADPTRLGQLVANLISNALKFTPAGGSVTVGVVLAGGDVVISVRDTGVGIPADELPRVFERFYRASTATAIAAPGTGIGLAIVRSIAAAHGGTVRVESEVGVGTTFTVVLPQEPPPDALIRKAAESSAAA
jgi:signal transduction histidine kinase